MFSCYELASICFSSKNSLQHFLKGRPGSDKFPQLSLFWKRTPFISEGQLCWVKYSSLTAFLLSTLNTGGRKNRVSFGQMAHLIGVPSCTPKGCGFDPWSGNIDRLWVQSPVGVCTGCTQSMFFLCHQCFFLCPSPLLLL